MKGDSEKTLNVKLSQLVFNPVDDITKEQALVEAKKREIAILEQRAKEEEAARSHAAKEAALAEARKRNENVDSSLAVKEYLNKMQKKIESAERKMNSF